MADENPGAGANSRAGGSLTFTDEEGVGAGRLQLLVANSNSASTVADGRFKWAPLFSATDGPSSKWITQALRTPVNGCARPESVHPATNR